jgi:alpha-methylacyl-CoA racemase
LPAPLAGVRVVDLTRLLPFSYGTQFLVDLGAEVIKVEQPGGEVGRAFRPMYAATNRGKRSVTLDLRSTRDRERLLRLLTTADALIESFRPGYLDELGLAFDTVREQRADIVYCSITGHAADAPTRERAGHDLNFYAMSGAARPTADVVPSGPSIPFVDLAVGIHLAYSVAGCLLGVARGNGGTHLQLAMSELALSLSTPLLNFTAHPDHVPMPFQEFVRNEVPCHHLWKTLDGEWIALCNVEPKFWLDFLRAIDRLDLADDALAIGERAREVTEQIAYAISSRTSDEWETTFADYDVCFSRVLTPEQVLTHPEYTNGVIRASDESVEVLFPGRLNGARPVRQRFLQPPGADNAELLD